MFGLLKKGLRKNDSGIIEFSQKNQICKLVEGRGDRVLLYMSMLSDRGPVYTWWDLDRSNKAFRLARHLENLAGLDTLLWWADRGFTCPISYTSSDGEGIFPRAGGRNSWSWNVSALLFRICSQKAGKYPNIRKWKRRKTLVLRRWFCQAWSSGWNCGYKKTSSNVSFSNRQRWQIMHTVVVCRQIKTVSHPSGMINSD